MRLLIRVLLGLCGALTLAPCAVRAQNPPPSATPTLPAYRHRLLGVYDDATGEPLAGVEVQDVLNGTSALTTSTGTVTLAFLPDGGGMVRLRKVGYEVQTMVIAISPADTVPVTVVLQRATTLEKVVVHDSAVIHSPRMSTFDERRRRGLGQFVDEPLFRKNDNMTMANFLVGHLTGMQMIVSGRGSYLVSSRTMCAGPAFSHCRQPSCYVTVVVDGIRMYDATMDRAALPDFGRMNVRDYMAAEFYPGGATLPAGISATNSQCGTLVLYTRER